MKNKYIHLRNKRYFSKNKVLFWATVIATVFQVGWLTLEMLGYQPVLFEMTTVYLLILITYALHNRILKWRDGTHRVRKGEFFVYFFWAYTFFIYTFYIFDLVTKIPDQLSMTFGGITTIFFGSEVIKLVGRLLQEK